MNAQNSNLTLDSMQKLSFSQKGFIDFSLDTNIRKDHSIARPFGDDPFALDGFGDCKFALFIESLMICFY
jgi:hypothetical protein